MSGKVSLSGRIAIVEQRLDLRRQNAVHDVQDLRAAFRHATRWLPLLAVGGALVAGLALARRGPKVRNTRTATAGMAATLLSLAGAALRFAVSPQGRAIWSALRTPRTGEPR